MESLNKSFNKGKFKQVTVYDSRFGKRKFYLNKEEKPSIFTYNNPGRHWWGTK